MTTVKNVAEELDDHAEWLRNGAPRPKAAHPRMYAKHRAKLDHEIYQNRQWSETEFGIENHLGPVHYYIPWSDIRPTPEGKYGRPQHMADKNRVDTESKNAAYRTALEMKANGYRPPVRVPHGDDA